MKMRQYALDPHRTKMNIMDFIPKQPIVVTPTQLAKKGKKKVQMQLCTKDYIDELDLKLSDDDEMAMFEIDESAKKRRQEEERLEKQRE